jgi:hypothetical protein
VLRHRHQLLRAGRVQQRTAPCVQAYKAMCTPEFYVFDADAKLQYHAQFDAARPGRAGKPVTGRDLRAALDAVLEGKRAPAAPPSMGCGVKWHPGKQPAYAS